MKRNRCVECDREIEPIDFFMECRAGNICSDCLIEGGPLKESKVEFFRPRGLNLDSFGTTKRTTDARGVLLNIPIKDAL